MTDSFEDSNRNGRRGNDSKTGSQSRQSGPSRDGTPGAGQARRGGKVGGSSMSRSGDNLQNGPPAQAPAPSSTEPALSAVVNTAAIDAVLKQGFDPKVPTYKLEAKPQATRSESPWGSKLISAGAMANGKDFWLELRKQVYALQLSGGTSQGG